MKRPHPDDSNDTNKRRRVAVLAKGFSNMSLDTNANHEPIPLEPDVSYPPDSASTSTSNSVPFSAPDAMEIEEVTGPGPSQLFTISVEEPTSPSSRTGKLRDVRMKGQPSWYEPEPDREPASLTSQTTTIINSPPPRRPAGIIITDLDDSEDESSEDSDKTQNDIEISPALLQRIRQNNILRSTLPSSAEARGQALVLYRPLTIPEEGAREEDRKEEGTIPTPIPIATPADVETPAMDVDVPMDVEP
ncbi:hypothetical protein AAF712_000609 [Marasmius tenuissimus]|uniref:Uncharacterized protein n=1 Tax=Marasmius tenuissimus TaxID=585030 RepID=A0ABR3AFY6_9AGAR